MNQLNVWLGIKLWMNGFKDMLFRLWKIFTEGSIEKESSPRISPTINRTTGKSRTKSSKNGYRMLKE